LGGVGKEERGINKEKKDNRKRKTGNINTWKVGGHVTQKKPTGGCGERTWKDPFSSKKKKKKKVEQ